jgi:diguanylate cyclase (GGDEF)-like protein/PAS domain S-box-containing protein
MIKNMKLSIKTLFIALTLFAVIFVSYIAYILSSNAMDKLFLQESKKHFEQSVRFTQSILDNELLKLESAFGTIAFKDEDIQAFLNQDQEYVRTLLQRPLSQAFDFAVIIPHGQKPIFNSNFLYNTDNLVSQLQYIKTASITKHIIPVFNDENHLFMVITRGIIDPTTLEVIGLFAAGIEISNNIELLNKIKVSSKLSRVDIYYGDTKILSDSTENHKQLCMLLNKYDEIFICPTNKGIVGYRDTLDFNSNKSSLNVKMISTSDILDDLSMLLKRDLLIIFLFMTGMVILFIGISNKLFIQPIDLLKNYASNFVSEKDVKTDITLHIKEYEDLFLYLKQTFQEILKKQQELIEAKTKQEEISQALVEQQHKLDEYLKTIDDYVMVTKTDLRGIITFVSSAFCRLSGYTKEQLIGQTHSIMKDPQASKELFTNMWRTITLGNVWHGEMSNIDIHGRRYWVKAYITPIYENNQIIGYTSIKEDITDKKRVEELATKDYLTKLYNRHYITARLREMELDYQRTKEKFCVIILDIDYFKKVNDTYGHLVGDKVLVDVANNIKDSCRASDIVGRWGGEEFLIILPRIDEDNCYSVADKIRQAVETANFGEVGRVTVSMGLCVYDNDLESTLKLADERLYQAKRNGRNQVVCN